MLIGYSLGTGQETQSRFRSTLGHEEFLPEGVAGQLLREIGGIILAQRELTWNLR